MQESQQFRIHLERLGYSKTSILMLPNCLKEFLEYTDKPTQNITPQDIKNYHTYLQERPNRRRTGGLSESYINHHLYALKLYFGWQEELRQIRINPISGLTFKTPESKPREILTTAEITQLYKATQTLKERAVLSLFYGCGLRRSEGEKLNLTDIHFGSGILYVREGKGNKRRAVPMSKKVSQDLKNYVEKERVAKSQEQAMICNQYGTRTKGADLNRLLKNALERTKIDKSITLHCLRHSIATHLLESGLTIEYVRDFLGHKHLETTQIYTRVKNSQLWDL